MNAPSDIKSYMLQVGQRARVAAREVARADTDTKNRALIAAARALRRDAKKLIAANAVDIQSAQIAGKDAAFIDRLTLTDKSIDAMAEGLEQVAGLPIPSGRSASCASSRAESRSGACAFRWASSASSTSRAPT